LPNNEDLIGKLTRKLEEYKHRLAMQREKTDDGFTSIERGLELTADSHYKVAVLEELLKNGRVNTHDLSRKLKEEDHGIFYASEFGRACAVIDNYTKNIENSGGTGLK